MTLVLLSGGLTFVVGLLIVRPFSIARGRLQVRGQNPDDGRRRELLRQLRDLDDDLAAGKLTEADHVRLRGPVEREAAAVLRRKTSIAAAEGRAVGSGARSAPPATDRPKGPDIGGRRHWRRPTALGLALAGAAVGVTVLLVSTVSPRTTGQSITGNSVPGASVAPGSGSSAAPVSAKSGKKSPTPQQLAAVAAAEAQVKANPGDVNAHLALAEAYSAAGAGQLAAVEYLAVTRLDPANAEANTNLALLAFNVGHAAQAKAMVDRVLAADPNYPEALYVRGVINLIGLRRPAAAERDLNAYLAMAPFGSQRTAAVTLLALAQTQGHK